MGERTEVDRDAFYRLMAPRNVHPTCVQLYTPDRVFHPVSEWKTPDGSLLGWSESEGDVDRYYLSERGAAGGGA